MLAYVMSPYKFGWSLFFFVQARARARMARASLPLHQLALAAPRRARRRHAAGRARCALRFYVHSRPRARHYPPPLQAPLVLAEQKFWKLVGATGVKLPWAFHLLVTQCLLVASAHLFFFPVRAARRGPRVLPCQPARSRCTQRPARPRSAARRATPVPP